MPIMISQPKSYQQPYEQVADSHNHCAMLRSHVALTPAQRIACNAALHTDCTAMQNQATMYAITIGNQLASSITYKLYVMLCWYCKSPATFVM